MRNFRELDIWNRAIRISKRVYELTDSFPDREKYGLSSQIQRAAVSIASNIAEGASRKSEIDFARYLEIAIGSSFEVETQITIAKEINYINDNQYNELLNELVVIQKQLNILISKIRNK